jgi:hypothetical protein
MLSLLTAFFLYAGDADLYWWAIWSLITGYNLAHAYRHNGKI